jgi:hypothetical protein
LGRRLSARSRQSLRPQDAEYSLYKRERLALTVSPLLGKNPDAGKDLVWARTLAGSIKPDESACRAIYIKPLIEIILRVALETMYRTLLAAGAPRSCTAMNNLRPLFGKQPASTTPKGTTRTRFLAGGLWFLVGRRAPQLYCTVRACTRHRPTACGHLHARHAGQLLCQKLPTAATRLRATQPLNSTDAVTGSGGPQRQRSYVKPCAHPAAQYLAEPHEGLGDLLSQAGAGQGPVAGPAARAWAGGRAPCGTRPAR